MPLRHSPFRSRNVWLVLALMALGWVVLWAQPPLKPGKPIINAPGAKAGTLSVPLTIQETLYTGGTSGVARTTEPVSVGIPLPDNSDVGTAEVSDLTLTGASGLQQFRVLGRWPSGRIKWVQVDTQATLLAGGSNTGVTLTKVRGSGNAGGFNLATDNGTTITVATGTGGCTFTIKKANFNGFDVVTCGSGPTTIVATGTSTGLVVMGPAFSGTTSTCGTCTTVYSSANDGSSTATIEENGPVRAVIKAEGGYKDGSGNTYLKFTVRMHFYKGKGYVRAATSLRNADYGTSDSFATAYKGMAANEWRLTANIAGTRSYRIAKDAGTEATGTMSGSNDVYVYAGQTEWLRHEQWGGSGAVPPTNDEGWKVILNGNTGSPVDSGPIAEHVDGWADIRDASGVGVSIGIEQMHAWWDKSLEFKSGGSDVRIGIFSAYNSRIYHQAWPHHSTHDLYFNFHDSALVSPVNEFLKFQHYLVARPSLTYFNSTRAWPHQIASDTQEDAFYSTTVSTANPTQTQSVASVADASPSGGSLSNGNALRVYRNWDWGSGGESNQQDWRIGWEDQWLSRGFDARLLNAKYFYRYLMNDVGPRSDGFTWRAQAAGVKTTVGWPTATSLNATSGFRAMGATGNWGASGGIPDHSHWYGMGIHYFLTGDEGVKDAFLDGYADWSLDSGTTQAGITISGEIGGDGTAESRIASLSIITAVYMARFLRDIGMPTESALALTNAETLYHADFDDVLCTRQEESAQSCDSQTVLSVEGIDGMIPQSINGNTLNEGISRTRGIIWNGGGIHTWCNVSETNQYDSWRLTSVWSGQAWWAWALYELSEAKGSAWSDYWTARDLSYGIIQAAEEEFWEQQGNGRWDQDGFKLYTAFDRPGNCANPPPANDGEYFKGTFCGGSGFCSPQSHWIMFSVKQRLTGSQDWIPKARVGINKALQYTGGSTPDWYGWMANTMIADANTTPTTTLQNVSVTATHQGSGNYLLSWTVPSGAQSYRIKWGAKTIVEVIGFNEYTGAFVGNPTTTMPWFAANNVASVPTPGTGGTVQTTTVATGNTGLASANFSVKAYVATVVSPTLITWTQQSTPTGLPSSNWFFSWVYDALSGQNLIYGIPSTGSGIYSSAFHAYNPITNVFTFMGGSSNTACATSDHSPSPWPGNRHPMQHYAVDRIRNRLGLLGGVCANVVRQDYWHYTLNANPTTNTWTNVNAEGTLTGPEDLWGHLVWSEYYDAMFFMGGDSYETWVRCSGTGSPTSPQTAIGCSSLNTWIQVDGPLDPTSTGPRDTYGAYNTAAFDPNLRKILLFTASEGGSRPRVNWQYNPETTVWSNMASSNIPTETAMRATGVKDHVYISSGPFAGTYLFHQPVTQASPACQTATRKTYTFSAQNNAYTELTNSGGGPKCSVYLGWNESAGKVVAWSEGAGGVEIWTGVLSQ